MIVPMKNVTLLCLASDADATLDALRDLGVLHVVPVAEPGGAELEAGRKRHETAAAALDILDRHAAEAGRKAAAAPHAAPSDDGSDMDRVVETVRTLAGLRKEFAERLASLREEKKTIEPYGDFDPDIIDQLARKGIRIKLYQTGSRKPIEPIEGPWTFPISRGPAGQYFAMVGMDADFDGGACEFVPHHRPLSVVEEDLRETRNDIEHTRREIGALAARREELRDHVAALGQRNMFLDVRAGMGDSGKVAYLRGFCPANIVERLTLAAGRHGWGLLVEDPSEEDTVPTLLSNPPWIRPIQALFDVLGIAPGYREVDISPAFMIFYSVFFAMLVGDAGYGLMFLGLTFLLRRLAPQTPRDLTRLLGLLSVSTIVWGALTGTWFSIAALPAPLRAMQVEWLRNDRNLMRLCFLIGAVHLTLAHAWVVARSWNRLTSLAELGWIAITWTVYFGAGALILDQPFPGFAVWMFAAGLVAVFLFMTPPRALKRDFHKHIMLPLTLIGGFGDLVSYVRLFAVGSATAAISVAFNELALGGGVRGAGDALTASLILLAAHGLNILLCALAVVVHGVRLNTLEFCGQMGVQWKGFAYKPFAKATASGAEPAASIQTERLKR